MRIPKTRRLANLPVIDDRLKDRSLSPLPGAVQDIPKVAETQGNITSTLQSSIALWAVSPQLKAFAVPARIHIRVEFTTSGRCTLQPRTSRTEMRRFRANPEASLTAAAHHWYSPVRSEISDDYGGEWYLISAKYMIQPTRRCSEKKARSPTSSLAPNQADDHGISSVRSEPRSSDEADGYELRLGILLARTNGLRTGEC
jgi:hypothetical protein